MMRTIVATWLAALGIGGGLSAHAACCMWEAPAASQVAFLDGGIGEEERAAMLATRERYNLQMIFANKGSGEYRADVDVEIRDAQGTLRFQVRQAGPLVYVQLPPGKYNVAAGVKDLRPTRSVVLCGTVRRELLFYWVAP